MQPRLRLHATPAAARSLRSGHPWLFAEKIREQNRPGQLGELAAVFDPHDCFLGIGLFDPTSPIRVRMLFAGAAQTIDDSWWKSRLASALARRAQLFGSDTTGCRLVHGESDGWPGLVLDRYDTTCVLKLYSGIWLPRLDHLLSWIQEKLPVTRLVLRFSRNLKTAAQTQFGLREGQLLFGPAILGPVIFLESGLRFEAEVVLGQKTGFFLDQRENRRRVERLARGRQVLNAFSFSGGFSVYAARGGASSVTEIDISHHALESAARNFALNGNAPHLAQCPRQAVQADVFDWLAGNPSGRFDLIVLDPPAMAKRQAERASAIRAYGRLVQLALPHLERDGILVACSCSAHVPASEFFEAVRKTIRGSGRNFKELETTRQPADHPATFPEAQYLKCIYAQIQD